MVQILFRLQLSSLVDLFFKNLFQFQEVFSGLLKFDLQENTNNYISLGSQYDGIARV